jgi:predicted ATPase/DNA-binding XRE family transcriptional regulator
MPYEEFGALLRHSRLEAGLSQEALAARAGLSVGAVASLERGRRRSPRASTVTALADALNLAPEARAALVHAARRHSAAAPEPPLIGRESELAQLASMLRASDGIHVITLVGPGGVGKTALAAALARTVVGTYRDGSATVDLFSLADPPELCAAIAHAVALGAAVSRAQELGSALAMHELLLILDSCERLPWLGAFVAEVAGRAPEVSIIATSRSPVRAPAERLFPVSPLATPWSSLGELGSSRGPLSAALAAASPAVQLFVARARQAAPDFRLTDDNAAAVATLCDRLGGLPLALELAAARTPLLTVTVLLERLDRSLDVLTTDSSAVPARHRSMSATLDWSYRMLTPPQRLLLAALSMFPGACAVAAVERVCGGWVDRHCVAGHDVVSLLGALLDTSMVLRVPGAQARVTMLDPVREYARDRLAECDRLEVLRESYFEYYLALAVNAAQLLARHDQEGYAAALEPEAHNLLAAAEHGHARSDGRLLELACAVWRFWYLRGELSRGRRQLELALTSAEGPERLRAEALRASAVLAFAQGDLAEARLLATEGLGLERKAGNADGTADALNTLGNIARELGHFDDALEHYRESLALHRAGDNVWGEAVTLNNLGTTAAYRHDYALAEKLHAESLQLRQRLGDLHGVARCLDGLASVAREMSDPASALRYGRESLTLREQLGDRHGAAIVLITLAISLRGTRQLDAVAEHADRALRLGHDVGDAWVVAAALAVLAGVACDRRDWEDTARLAGAAHMHLERAGIKLRPADATRLGQDEAAARTALGESAYRCAWRIGRTIDRPRSRQP